MKHFKNMLFSDYCKGKDKRNPFFCYEAYETVWSHPSCVWEFEAVPDCHLVAEISSYQGFKKHCSEEYLSIFDKRSRFK